ncbi:MAG: GYD domain-containing protein, partial [Gammaproteobacteria bacterium]|nr:GYD domain-containing protein [Gammaproteobacteria bacterium]
ENVANATLENHPPQAYQRSDPGMFPCAFAGTPDPVLTEVPLMAPFLMLGNYSPAAIENVSAKRTRAVKSLIKKHGGRVKELYALLGEHDLAMLAEFPDVETAMRVSVLLGKSTGISFRTLPAVDVQTFDELASGAG